MKVGLLVVSKLLLQLFLFVIFLWYFGAESRAKFLEKKVIVVQSTEETDGIPSPAVTVCGTGLGWKNLKNNLDSVLDACNSSDNVFDCVNSQKKDFKDIVLDASKGTKGGQNLARLINNKTLWHRQPSPYICHTLDVDMKIETDVAIGRITFNLNRTLNYVFHIHSPELYFQSTNSLALPAVNNVKVFLPSDCNSYITLALNQHHKLNTPSRPCEEAPEYSFTDCVIESMARQVGCVSGQDGGNWKCTNIEQYR